MCSTRIEVINTMRLQRSGENTWRDKGALIGKVVSSMFFALFLGGIYSNITYDQKSIQDRIGGYLSIL